LSCDKARLLLSLWIQKSRTIAQITTLVTRKVIAQDDSDFILSVPQNSE
jgi:hypothetical protein